MRRGASRTHVPTPSISVVVPTLNRPALLAGLVRSLQSQTMRQWEAVVVDDGSGPEEWLRIQELARGEPRIVLLRRDADPAGGGRCRNLGAAAARSQLVMFFDDDDLLTPECLSARLRVMEENPLLEFAVFPHRRFSATPGDLEASSRPQQDGDPIDAYLRIEPPWHTGGPVYRRAFLERVGGWHEGLNSWQDWEFGLRALALRPRHALCAAPAFHVRVASARHESISGGGRSPKHVRSWPLAVEACVKHLRTAGLLSARREMLVGRLYLFIAERLVEIGAEDEARDVWRRATECGFAAPQEAWIGRLILCIGDRRIVTPTLRIALDALQRARESLAR
jgi:hypothetical protein